jgi:Homeodomain-like domain
MSARPLDHYIAEAQRAYRRTANPAKGRANMSGFFDDLLEQRTEFGVTLLSWRDLARLSARMRSIDPKWRPRAKWRRMVALGALAEGAPPKRIADQLGISRTTLWRLR